MEILGMANSEYEGIYWSMKIIGGTIYVLRKDRKMAYVAGERDFWVQAQYDVNDENISLQWV